MNGKTTLWKNGKKVRVDGPHRGTMFWPSNQRGTYDPFGKLKAAWAATAAGRRRRNQAAA